MTILMEDICKSYNGKTVLDHVTAEIEWDRQYAFVGDAGCGKSTLLKIFMGKENPDSGKVHRMGDYKYPQLLSAYVPQEEALNLNKSAVWNVKKAAFRVSAKMAANELGFFFSNERMQLTMNELTQAERRYTAIVKALIVAADFLVFDEPFSGMNNEERAKALDYIEKNRGSRPLLIASRSEDGLGFAKIKHL